MEFLWFHGFSHCVLRSLGDSADGPWGPREGREHLRLELVLPFQRAAPLSSAYILGIYSEHDFIGKKKKTSVAK